MTWLTRFHTRPRPPIIEASRDRRHGCFSKGGPSATPEETADASLMFGAAVAVCLRFLVRAVHVLATDFPLNDGGLFI
jgi:hypothetical protein